MTSYPSNYYRTARELLWLPGSQQMWKRIKRRWDFRDCIQAKRGRLLYSWNRRWRWILHSEQWWHLYWWSVQHETQRFNEQFVWSWRIESNGHKLRKCGWRILWCLWTDGTKGILWRLTFESVISNADQHQFLHFKPVSTIWRQNSAFLSTQQWTRRHWRKIYKFWNSIWGDATFPKK